MIKKFTISCTLDDETGDLQVNTTAEGGITPLEIIGLLELKRLDMFRQMLDGAAFERNRVNEDGSVERITEKKPKKARGTKKKYICKKEIEPLILEPEDYPGEAWSTILKIFGMEEADKIVISDYKFEAYGKEKGNGKAN